MTHDELLAKVIDTTVDNTNETALNIYLNTLIRVVELHKPFNVTMNSSYGKEWNFTHCGCKGDFYPCDTIKLIEKELV